MQRRRPSRPASRNRGGLVAVVLAGAAAATACGSSTNAQTTPSPTLAESATPPPSETTVPTVSPTTSATNPATAAIATGPKSASCVNGWVQPAPGSDFYKQASQALQQSQGGAAYVLWSARYFAGPLPSGGIGAVYYLDVRDPRLTARVLLVSGAGPASAAVAPEGTTGWKAGDWVAFKGTNPPAVPTLTGIAHPGKWAGPEYDPVGGTTPLLSASLTGCLDGT